MNSDYELKKGDIVVSFRGHDRNKLLAVIESFGDSVIVADGDTRPIEKAKQKNVKHVRYYCGSEELACSIESGVLTDEALRRVLSDVKKNAEIKKFR